ncbi:MAG: hypothetical protein A2Y15_07485 [Clostridiales bacterium GWF2_36_10]|nr:MAG: hypothetical protein A2Y15_07485 [Clostridiales bacterium GWF2_36_10]
MTENNNDFNKPNDDMGENNNAQSEQEQNINNTPAQPNTPTEQNGAGYQPPYLYSWDGAKPHPAKKKKGLKVFASIVSICLILTILLTVWSINMGYIPNVFDSSSDEVSESSADNNDDNSKNTISVPEVIATGDDATETTSDLTVLYNKIKNSCVSIQTDVALGSGFVVTEDGYVITNHHVINDAKEITVVFYDNTKYTAELIGSDEVRDIAVLKIEGEFTPIEIGDSDSVEIGERVVAVGTPYNIKLAGTMNEGIISGIAREIEVTNETGAVVKTMTLLQTDTSINPGNSGGPLINMAGQVIGINTMKLMNEYEGLGFAIPIKNAIAIANTLIEFGVVDGSPDDDFVKATARLNIVVMNIADAISEFNIETDVDLPEGAFVFEVNYNSSIYAAGLELYDIITEFNGVAVSSKEDLIEELGKYQAGDTVLIKVFRMSRQRDSGEYHEFSFKLDSASSS